METRGKADRSPDEATKFLPKQGGELWTPIRHDIFGETVDLKNVVNDYLRSLLSGGKLRERDKTGGLREAVDNGENYGLASGQREASDKVKRYLSPWSRRNG